MDALLEQLWSPLEATAVALAVLYLVLLIRENILAWPCGGASSAIYVAILIEARLYMESALYFVYFVMAIYGWSVWYRGRTPDRELPVTVWPARGHACAVLAILAVSAVSGYLLDAGTDAALPYVDSLTTWSAIWATFLAARKVLENWWYWLAIDAASVLIYWSRDLQLTALLFVVYVVMIPFGLVSWHRSWREATA